MKSITLLFLSIVSIGSASYTLNPSWSAPSTDSINDVVVQPNTEYSVVLYHKVHTPPPYDTSPYVGVEYFYNGAYTSNWTITGISPSIAGSYTISWGARNYSTSTLYCSLTSYNSFNLRVLSIYDNWRLTYFKTLDETGSYANESDFDGDGHSNLLEYALGTDPTDKNTSLTQVTTNAQGYLELTFNKISDPSIQYQVQGSIDLKNWNTLWTEFGNGTLSPESKTVQDVLPLSNFNSRFLRVKIIKN